MSVFIGSIVRNEHRDIREWVLHHQSLGVEHITLYDNNSNTGYEQELGDIIKAGYVDMKPWPGNYMFRQHAQMCDMCFNRNWGDNDWGVFIDADEFLHLDRHKSVQALVDEYPGVAGIVVSWMMYGANGHVKRPDLPVSESFTKMAPLIRANHNFKSIVRFNDVGFWNDVHRFTPRNGKHVINLRGRIVHNSWQDQVLDGAHIKHYVTKSWEEFVTRLERGNITPGCRGIETFFMYNEDMRDLQDELVQDLDIGKFPTLCISRDIHAMLQVFFESDIYVRLTTAYDSDVSDDKFKDVCLAELPNFFEFHYNNLKQRPPKELERIKERCHDLFVLQSEFVKALPTDMTDYRKALIEVIINTPFHRNVVPAGEM